MLTLREQRDPHSPSAPGATHLSSARTGSVTTSWIANGLQYTYIQVHTGTQSTHGPDKLMHTCVCTNSCTHVLPITHVYIYNIPPYIGIYISMHVYKHVSTCVHIHKCLYACSLGYMHHTPIPAHQICLPLHIHGYICAHRIETPYSSQAGRHFAASGLRQPCTSRRWGPQYGGFGKHF